MADRKRMRPDEIEQFARQHGIRPDEAKKLIEEFGHDPAKLAEACAKAKVGTSAQGKCCQLEQFQQKCARFCVRNCENKQGDRAVPVFSELPEML